MRRRAGIAGGAWVVISISLVTGCKLVEPKEPAAAAPSAAPPPANERVATEDIRLHVKRVLGEMTMPADEKLAKLAEARRELLARRAPVLAELVREAESKRDSNEPEDATFTTAKTAVAGKEPLDAAAIKLLRSIHHARARMLLAKGMQLEALREVAVGVSGSGYGTAPLLSCGGDEPACVEVRAAVMQKWPSLCRGEAAHTECQLIDEFQMTSAASLERLPVLARFTVTKVTKRGAAPSVLGADYGPWNAELCKGRVETDRVVDVNERRVLVERTTWCKKIEQERKLGRKYVYDLPAMPEPPSAGADVLLLLEKGDVRVTKSGNVENVTVKASQVLAIDGGKVDSYLYGERVPADLARFPVDYTLPTLHD